MEETVPNKLSKWYIATSLFYILRECSFVSLQRETLPDTKIYKIIVRTEVFNHKRHSRRVDFSAAPVIVKSRDSSALVVILQLKDNLVHELRSLVARSSASSEVQLGPIKHVEILGDAPKNILGDSCSDRLIPLVEDIIRRCDNNVAP
jgi:uncharacterized protein YlaN (UPF0358 family)